MLYNNEDFIEIGRGSSRICYLTRNNKIVKVPFKEETGSLNPGIIQNKTEYKISNKVMLNDKKFKRLINKVEKIWEDKNGLILIEQEKIRCLDKEIRKLFLNNEISDRKFDSFVLYGIYEEEDLQVLSHKLNFKYDKDFLDDLFLLSVKYNLQISDLHSINNLGINKNNELVLLDYGFDEDLSDMYDKVYFPE